MVPFLSVRSSLQKFGVPRDQSRPQLMTPQPERTDSAGALTLALSPYAEFIHRRVVNAFEKHLRVNYRTERGGATTSVSCATSVRLRDSRGGLFAKRDSP